jgi:rare lipoprotein A
VLLLLSACARPVAVSPPAPAPPVLALPPVPGAEETGEASWYGAPHHGRRTASGEVYDMHGFTAAHRTLSFGTRVRVTNTRTGQAVEVRINDRGPFVDGRILDLSYAAAAALGARGPGVIPVRLQVTAAPGAESGVRPARFAVQLGSFASRTGADRLRESLEREGTDAGIDELVVGGQTYYRVRVGAYADRGAAQAAAHELAERGYRPVVVER